MSQFYEGADPSAPRKDRLEYLEEEDLHRLEDAVNRGARAALVAMVTLLALLVLLIACAIEFPSYQNEAIWGIVLLAVSAAIHRPAYVATKQTRLWGPQVVALMHAIYLLLAIGSIALVVKANYQHPRDLLIGIIPGCIVMFFSLVIAKSAYTAAMAIPPLRRNPLWVAQEAKRERESLGLKSR